jgi:cell cycle protein kinase DBF2
VVCVCVCVWFVLTFLFSLSFFPFRVYLCRHKKTQDVIALKRINKSNLHVKNQVAAVSAERDVLRSATTDSGDVADMTMDTSWLTRLLYAFQDSVFIYFGMEFVAGGDFGTFLGNVGELEEDQARQYAAEMFKGVDVLHQLGYIHRDLKPDK